MSSQRLLLDHQSAYRSCLSAETAIVAVHDEIVRICAVVLVYLSAVFDTVDHQILLQILDKRLANRTVCQRSQTFCVNGQPAGPYGLQHPQSLEFATVTFDDWSKYENFSDQILRLNSFTSLVFSRLDYCNAILAGITRSTIAPLQRVQNACITSVLFRVLVHVITWPRLWNTVTGYLSNSESCSNYVFWCSNQQDRTGRATSTELYILWSELSRRKLSPTAQFFLLQNRRGLINIHEHLLVCGLWRKHGWEAGPPWCCWHWRWRWRVGLCQITCNTGVASTRSILG